MAVAGLLPGGGADKNAKPRKRKMVPGTQEPRDVAEKKQSLRTLLSQEPDPNAVQEREEPGT